MNEAPPAPRSRGCFIWGVGILTVIIIASLWGWWAWERANARSIAYSREMAKRTTYEARLFPASVTFQRGPARENNLYGPKPWRDLPGEIAECPDDSEGRDFGEFYQTTDPTFTSRAFADATHPEVASRLASFFDVDAKELFAAAIILSESDISGWKFRTTFVPTPHGGTVAPENLPPPVLARLAAIKPPTPPTMGKVEVDPRHYSGGIQGKSYSGKSRDQVEREAQQRAENQHRQSKDLHDRHHHHFYLVEAVRDFGQGRVVVLRRFGQVYGPGAITRADGTLKNMAASVSLSSP